MTGTATILRGNALDLPLADASVDLIITSPPYFALRSYQDGGEHYPGQIGSEATPAEFVDALLAATAEMVRVLKPSGSLWVNLGDKYSTGSSGDRNTGFNERFGNAPGKRAQERSQRASAPSAGFPPKTLLGIPWRYALACTGGGPVVDAQFARALVRDVAQGWLTLAEAEAMLDEAQEMADPGLGLILRAEVIWAKPNGLPESVTDRVRRSHETWFHLVKQPRYFSAVDEIREATTDYRVVNGRERNVGGRSDGFTIPVGNVAPNPLGKLPGSVWTIPTQPLTVPAHLGVDHFAAFPMEWPRRIIQGWSPSGVCTACGEGRRPVVSAEYSNWAVQPNFAKRREAEPGRALSYASGQRALRSTTIDGYACACTPTRVKKVPTVYHDPRGYDEVTIYAWDEWDPAPTTPAVILDPFGGTGTVALVAKALGRHGISLDMSADYCRLATWRTTDEGEYARALQVEKPAKQVDGQLSLLEVLA